MTLGYLKLKIAVDGLPETYRPYTHGRVREPPVAPIRIYFICAADSPTIIP